MLVDSPGIKNILSGSGFSNHSGKESICPRGGGSDGLSVLQIQESGEQETPAPLQGRRYHSHDLRDQVPRVREDLPRIRQGELRADPVGEDHGADRNGRREGGKHSGMASSPPGTGSEGVLLREKICRMCAECLFQE